MPSISGNEHPTARGGGINILGPCLIVLMTLAVGLRYYVRFFLKRTPGIDDVLIGVALLSAIAFDVLIIIASEYYGFRLHVYDIPENRLESTLKAAMLCKILFTCSATFTRASILSFYTRVVKGSGNRSFIRGVYWGQATNIMSAAVMLGLAIGLCYPVDLYWNWQARLSGAFGQSCLNEQVATLIAGIMNAMSDLLTTALPLRVIWQLKLPARQRLGVTLLLSLGVLVTVIGAVRTWLLWNTFHNFDLSWNSFPLWIVAMVEISLMVICACAPALHPLSRRAVQSIRSFSTSTVGIPPTSNNTTQDQRDPEMQAQPRPEDLQELQKKLCNPQYHYETTPQLYMSKCGTKFADATTETKSSGSFDGSESPSEWFQRNKDSRRSEQTLETYSDEDENPLSTYQRAFARLEQRHGGDQRASKVM